MYYKIILYYWWTYLESELRSEWNKLLTQFSSFFPQNYYMDMDKTWNIMHRSYRPLIWCFYTVIINR